MEENFITKQFLNDLRTEISKNMNPISIDFCDYWELKHRPTGYIDDKIHEYADSTIGLGCESLAEWINENPYKAFDLADEAIRELGGEDIMSIFSGAQYLDAYYKLMEDHEKICELLALDYIIAEYEAKDEDALNALLDEASKCERLEDIAELVEGSCRCEE